MRNPKESWHLNDTREYLETDFSKAKNVLFTIDGVAACVEVGPNDLKLAQTLIRAGSEHRKFMREITVSMDITAPLYW